MTGRGATTGIAPEELVHRFRQQFDEPLEYLEKTLPTLSAVVPAQEVLTVSGLDAIRNEPLGFDEWDRWWQADPDLRTLILGRSLEEANRDGQGTEKEASE